MPGETGVLLVDISVQIGDENMLAVTLKIHSDMTGLSN